MVLTQKQIQRLFFMLNAYLPNAAERQHHCVGGPWTGQKVFFGQTRQTLTVRIGEHKGYYLMRGFNALWVSV